MREEDLQTCLEEFLSIKTSYKFSQADGGAYVIAESNGADNAQIIASEPMDLRGGKVKRWNANSPDELYKYIVEAHKHAFRGTNSVETFICDLCTDYMESFSAESD